MPERTEIALPVPTMAFLQPSPAIAMLFGLSGASPCPTTSKGHCWMWHNEAKSLISDIQSYRFKCQVGGSLVGYYPQTRELLHFLCWWECGGRFLFPTDWSVKVLTHIHWKSCNVSTPEVPIVLQHIRLLFCAFLRHSLIRILFTNYRVVLNSARRHQPSSNSKDGDHSWTYLFNG